MSSLRCLLTVTLAVLLSAMASASSKAPPIQIKVLSAESQSFKAPPLVPRDCNWLDFSAYCYDSSPRTYIENTMVVQENDGKSLEIACTVDNQWSHCTDLPANHTFEASLGKHGLEIRYLDQDHKMRKGLYEIVKENGSRH